MCGRLHLVAISDKPGLLLYDSDKISHCQKGADFCHSLMLSQIIFVILCPEYDNLKQGKPKRIC